jgi:NADH-quinone oxidoreductase subunit A
VFLSLDFVYVPTDDVDAAAGQYTESLGARLRWRVRALGTTVACLQVAESGPDILLAGHLGGSVPILIYRVPDYRAAVAELRAQGVDDLREVEIPHGPCATFRAVGGQRLAVYELTRPEVGDPSRTDSTRRPPRLEVIGVGIRPLLPRVAVGSTGLGQLWPVQKGFTSLARVSEFLRQYLTVAVFAVAAVAMVGAMLGVGSLLRPTRPQPEKYISYESGVDPVGAGWTQSQIRYYVFALLFVLFDVEAVFILPWAIRLESYGVFGLVEMLIFIAILALGLLYAWRKRVLRWL